MSEKACDNNTFYKTFQLNFLKNAEREQKTRSIVSMSLAYISMHSKFLQAQQITSSNLSHFIEPELFIQTIVYFVICSLVCLFVCLLACWTIIVLLLLWFSSMFLLLRRCFSFYLLAFFTLIVFQNVQTWPISIFYFLIFVYLYIYIYLQGSRHEI